jgi:nitrile hydratase
MNGVHDMGGMAGLGRVAPEPDEPLFHEPWEARALALTLATAAWRRWNLDAMRHERELIPGPDYLRMSYYERWTEGLMALLTKRGLITAEELASGRPDPDTPKATPPLGAEAARAVIFGVGGTLRASDAAPRFSIGEAVRARNIHPAGHTRLPRYARGRRGRITRDHGAHVFPDTNAHGLGEQPRRLYQVRFEADELWGEAAGWRGAVHIDLWEPYLEPA